MSEHDNAPLLLSSTLVGDVGGVWRLRFEGSARTRAFDSGAHEAWRTVLRALSRSAALTPRGLRDRERVPLSAEQLAVWVRDGDTPQGPSTAELSGASYGVSFAVSVLALETAIVPRYRVAATGVVAHNGELQSVDGLGSKIAALARYESEPSCHDPIEYLLVPDIPSVVEDARRLGEKHGLRAEVRAFGTLAQVIDFLFPNIEEAWLEAITRDGAIDEAVDAMARTAFGPRTALVDWTPLRNAACVLTKHIDPSKQEVHQQLAFVADVASRHQGGDPMHLLGAPLDLDEFVHSLAKARRLDAVAQLVQQAADCGWPDADFVEQCAARFYVPDAHERLERDLRLCGALGRFAAACGDLDAAERHAVSAIEGWLGLNAPGETSLPLSHLYLIASMWPATNAERATRTFEAAEAFDTRVRAALGEGARWVDCARARSMCSIGVAPQICADAFQRVADDKAVPEHLAYQAIRWRAVAMGRTGGPPAVPRELLSALDGSMTQRETAAANLAMLALHFALVGHPVRRCDVQLDSSTAPLDAQAALTWHGEARPGLTRVLTAGFSGIDACRRVNRLNPY